MGKHSAIGQQVKSGLWLTAAWLLGMAWLGLVYWGIGAITEPGGNLSEQTHSRFLGYMLLIVAAAIFVATANRWKRVFPGIMLAATLGALLELERGHAVNSPSVLIPRPIALVQLVVICGVTALSFTFKKRPLNIVDRIALLAFAASIYVGGDEATRRELPVASIVGGLCVLAAWMHERVQRRRRSENSSG
jgi:hypothetical protein